MGKPEKEREKTKAQPQQKAKEAPKKAAEAAPAKEVKDLKRKSEVKEVKEPKEPKGKQREVLQQHYDDDSEEEDEDSDDESGDHGIIDVDFEFFNLKENDFHSVKHFLSVLFDKDIDLNELTELLLAQTTVGTSVKVDGTSDPYSFLTVLNLTHHKNTNCSKQIQQYLLKNMTGEPQQKLKKYFDDLSKHVGIIFNERLINMPIQTAPPMFKMLLEEIQWAFEEGKPFNFEYYVFLIKTYKEKVMLEEDDSSQHKAKKPRTMTNEEVFYFNEEEEVIAKAAEFTCDFKFGKGAAKWTLQEAGIVPYRRIAVVHRSKMAGIIKEMEELVAQALKPQ